MSEERFLCPDGTCDRADKVLVSAFPQASRSQIKRAIEAGKIRREDGNPLDPKSKLTSGDSLLVDLAPPKSQVHSPVPIPLAVLFEDEDLIVIDKIAGMVVHPGDGTGQDTLVHALLHHCQGFPLLSRSSRSSGDRSSPGQGNERGHGGGQDGTSLPFAGRAIFGENDGEDLPRSRRRSSPSVRRGDCPADRASS